MRKAATVHIEIPILLSGLFDMMYNYSMFELTNKQVNYDWISN
jgi:hypothetical protein